MSSLKDWSLEIDSSIFKTLKRIPQQYVERILFMIKSIPLNPYFGDIQKMKNEENVWRRRTGAYRIFYKIKMKEKIILVFKLERRGSKTY